MSLSYTSLGLRLVVFHPLEFDFQLRLSQNSFHLYIKEMKNDNQTDATVTKTIQITNYFLFSCLR